MGIYDQRHHKIEDLIAEFAYYQEAEEILEGLYLHLGPYADLPQELLSKLHRHFDFDDSE